jgi:hypothetical protein
MHLLGEYFDEREWMLDFHSPSYYIRKEDLMNISGFAATKNIRETMSSIYLSCTKYDRMYRECVNTFGPALLQNPFAKEHADCNRIRTAFTTCVKNHQWYHETKKYHPELFGAWRGSKQFKGFSNYNTVLPEDF